MKKAIGVILYLVGFIIICLGFLWWVVLMRRMTI